MSWISRIVHTSVRNAYASSGVSSSSSAAVNASTSDVRTRSSAMFASLPAVSMRTQDDVAMVAPGRDMMGMRTAEREDEATGGRVPDAAPALHGQAAEKALKALLTSRDRTFTKTHDIGAIGRAAIETDPDLDELV